MGTVVGYLGLSLVGDFLTRKKLLLVNLFLAVLGLTITIFSSSLMMAGVGLFFLAAGIRNAFNICFYFIAEIYD